jgi:hypothetical protein
MWCRVFAILSSNDHCKLSYDICALCIQQIMYREVKKIYLITSSLNWNLNKLFPNDHICSRKEDELYFKITYWKPHTKDCSRNGSSIGIVFLVIHKLIPDEKFVGHFVLLLSLCMVKIQQDGNNLQYEELNYKLQYLLLFNFYITEKSHF